MMDEPSLSQASSHFPLDPVTGDVLFKQETARRDGLGKRGNCLTGCSELDEEVLLGGFERGSVVGITAEEEDMGLLTITHLLASGLASATPSSPRAMIITTLSASTLLPMLRDVLEAQISLTQSRVADVKVQLRTCLEQIAISRVFDINGLWEVLGELDLPAQAHGNGPSASPQDQRQGQKLQHEAGLDEAVPPSMGETEILDSEDEGGLSSPESSRETPAKPPVPGEAAFAAKQANTFPGKDEASVSAVPDIVLVTHMSSLLTTLFTHREKATAHTTLQLMASHMRYLTRSPDHGGPLFLLLNSTTSSAAPNDSTSTGNADGAPRSPSDLPPPQPLRPPSRPHPPRPLDPTLRSIFNPPPQPYGYDAPPTRRNKPSFGLVFTQLLDLHLLCTRLPKRRADAEALFAPPPGSAGSLAAHGEGDGVGSPVAARQQQQQQQVEYATVVEVLLDEVGAWEVGGQGRRRSREQRWGAVEGRRKTEGGAMVRLVNAFEAPGNKHAGEIRLAAGFGGRIDR